MNYDITLLSKATATPLRSISPDIRDPREHIGTPVSRSIRWRQAVSAWLYRVADRVQPVPARNEHDELFEAISVLLAEPANQHAKLEPASRCGC